MNRQLVKELMEMVWQEYEYASILAASSTGKKYSASGQGISAAQDSLFCQRGYVIKAYDSKEKRYAEYSFNELTRDKMADIVNALRIVFEESKGLSGNEYAALIDTELKSFTENDFHQNPEEIGDEAILSRLVAIRKSGLAADERIIDCRVNSAYQIYEKYFLSPNREMSQKVLWMTGHLFMLARKGEEVKSYFESFSNRDGAAVLDVMEKSVSQVAKAAIDLTESENIIPGEYDCVCTPEVTGMIVHEAFGHGVEMDMFVKDRALAKQYIGKQVASELVTMHDGAAAATEVATYDFDDEGVPATDTIIIKDGILKTGINDAQTAMALAVGFTGNGRRENYERKAYTRMTNTFFEGGKDRPEDMIASIKYGFLLENATCGMEDPKNWGIQCMVGMAREIKEGRLTGKVFSPIVLSGYVPDLLKSISMMSENVELGGSGFCGKGYKEWVKVSDGGPYIKAKIKLG